MTGLLDAWVFHTACLTSLAAGISLAARVGGYFSFVPLAACLVGTFLAGAVAQSFGGIGIASLVGIATAALVGWTGWTCLHRRLEDKPLLHLLISLGASQVVQALVALIAGDDLRIFAGIEAARGWWSLIGVLVFLAFAWMWHCTAWGRIWRGCAANASLVEIIGIPAGRYVGGAFAMGSAMCAVGALAYATDTGYHTNFAFPIFLRGVTAAVVGGLGRPAGLLAGAACVSGVQILSSYFFNNQWADAIVFLILTGFLIWKPLGFSGRRLKKVEV